MTTGVNHITISVSDIERSFAFYSGTLGMRPVARWSTGAYLLARETWVALVEERSVPRGVRPDYTHLALTVPAASFGTARASLESTGAVSWKQNTSEGESCYFLDPDGHKLEIHATGLQDRLESMRAHPWERIEYFPAAQSTAPRVVHVCDVHDSTHVSRELGGRAQDFWDEFYTGLAEIVVAHGGQIIDYLGDCMYFVYGEGGCVPAVESALAMRAEFARMLSRYGIHTESELENGISAGDVTMRTVGHPSLPVIRVSGSAVGEAMALGCHRGVAVTAPVKELIEPRYSTRPIADVMDRRSDRPLKAWEIVEEPR